MLFSRSLLFPIFFRRIRQATATPGTILDFQPRPARGNGASQAQHSSMVLRMVHGGEARGVCDFSFPFFFWRMGKGTRRWDRGEGPWCIQQFLGLFLISKHCKTTTQTSKQPCQTLARTRPLHTDVDGWLGSLKKEETRGRGGSVRHTKPLPPKADGQTRRGKTTDPPPDFTCTQRAHQEAPSSFLATNMGGCPHGFLLVSPASR